MSKRPVREYFGVVIRLWGNHIAGPVAAIFALALPFIGMHFGSTPRVTLWLGVAPLSLAVLLIWPAQYEAWRQERVMRENEAEKNQLPEITGEITSAVARPANPQSMSDVMLYDGCHVFMFSLSVRNVRSPETNIGRIRLRAFDTKPILALFDAVVHSQQPDSTERVLRRGILNELDVVAYARFPDDYQFPDNGEIEFSAFYSIITDGFGRDHRVPARDGLKLYVLRGES